MIRHEELKKITFQVNDLCGATGKLIQKMRSDLSVVPMQSKSKNDFVTEVDKAAEIQLARGLGEIIPSAGFITEENTIEAEKRELTWIIDPIDGTTNFIHGIPCYSISIALMEEDQIILGTVYEINRDECFYSWLGAPAYLNGEQISVSNSQSLSETIISTGFPYRYYDQIDHYIRAFKVIMRETRGMRRWGSAAADLAYVACGRYDGFFEYGLSVWDVAAGAFLVKQAGGAAMDFSGGSDYLFGRQMVAGNKLICKDLSGILGKAYHNYRKPN